MRSAMTILGACAVAFTLSGCGSADEQPTSAPAPATPSVSMFTPDPTEPPPTLDITPAPEPSVESSAPPSESPSTLPPVEKPTPQGGPWTAVQVEATTAEQVAAATSLPETLRAFLASRIGVEDDAGCTTTQVTIRAVHADGFAFGSEDSTCGGGQAIWGITESQWHYIVQFEDSMPCRDLTTNEIPTGAPGLRCIDDDGNAKDY